VSLCAQDREILDLWAEGGVPDDPSTTAYAVDTLLLKLWAAYKELDAALGEVLALHAPTAEVRSDIRTAANAVRYSSWPDFMAEPMEQVANRLDRFAESIDPAADPAGGEAEPSAVIAGEGTEAPCVPPRATDAEASTEAPLPGPADPAGGDGDDEKCQNCGGLGDCPRCSGEGCGAPTKGEGYCWGGACVECNGSGLRVTAGGATTEATDG
jgi:hypothetical protein